MEEEHGDGKNEDDQDLDDFVNMKDDDDDDDDEDEEEDDDGSNDTDDGNTKKSMSMNSDDGGSATDKGDNGTTTKDGKEATTVADSKATAKPQPKLKEPPVASANENDNSNDDNDNKDNDTDPQDDSNDDEVPLHETRSAKIIMSRFSSWRTQTQTFLQSEKAKEWKDRATAKTTALLASEKTQKWKQSAVEFFNNPPVPKGGVAGKTKGTGNPKDDHDDDDTPGNDNNGGDDPPNEKLKVKRKEKKQSDNEDDDDDDDEDDQDNNDDDDDNNFVKMDDDNNDQRDKGAGDDSDDDTGFDAEEVVNRGVAAATAVRMAAKGMADQVATGFRGRYNSNAPIQVLGGGTGGSSKKKVTGTKSQTALILQSRAAANMQSILESLDESHEYVMLLGHGMLGVNLRQTYLRNHGVYVDYLVDGGSAASAGVVRPGDTIVSIGQKDVRKGTILDVPQSIADAKRPVVLKFSTGQKVDMKNVKYIDLAIAMLHKIRDDARNRRDIARMPLQDGGHRGNGTDGSSDDVGDGNSGNEKDNKNGWAIPSFPLDSLHLVNMSHPPDNVKNALAPHLSKR